MTKYEPLASTGIYYTGLTEYSMGLSMGTCKRCMFNNSEKILSVTPIEQI